MANICPKKLTVKRISFRSLLKIESLIRQGKRQTETELVELQCRVCGAELDICWGCRTLYHADGRCNCRIPLPTTPLSRLPVIQLRPELLQ